MEFLLCNDGSHNLDLAPLGAGQDVVQPHNSAIPEGDAGSYLTLRQGTTAAKRKSCPSDFGVAEPLKIRKTSASKPSPTRTTSVKTSAVKTAPMTPLTPPSSKTHEATANGSPANAPDPIAAIIANRIRIRREHAAQVAAADHKRTSAIEHAEPVEMVQNQASASSTSDGSETSDDDELASSVSGGSKAKATDGDDEDSDEDVSEGDSGRGVAAAMEAAKSPASASAVVKSPTKLRGPPGRIGLVEAAAGFKLHGRSLKDAKAVPCPLNLEPGFGKPGFLMCEAKMVSSSPMSSPTRASLPSLQRESQNAFVVDCGETPLPSLPTGESTLATPVTQLSRGIHQTRIATTTPSTPGTDSAAAAKKASPGPLGLALLQHKQHIRRLQRKLEGEREECDRLRRERDQLKVSSPKLRAR